MRAIVVHKFGATPELADMPVPEPGPGDVQVALDAAGVNPFDLKMADGLLEGKMPTDFPMILGVDGAGTVSAVGSGVTSFAVGDKVVGKFLTAPAGHGSWAQYATVPEDATLVKIPDGITSVAAAALPIAGLTAQDLVDAAHIQPGQTVLIVGATGGVGSFLVQLANIAGAHVIATARADATDQVARLGAAETVDYTQARPNSHDPGTQVDSSVVDAVRFTHPDGIDVLFDLVSTAPAFADHATLVRHGGHAYTTVWAADEQALSERGITGGNFESKGRGPELSRLLARVAAGDVVVPVQMTVPLEAAPAVLGAGSARGKTVLAI
ncbi:NADP-dependent oxidoreductase [Nocardia caishijiensis]|uniref:NADPH:quinone reductase-like Zn-dependent oxidoreductase n=1 Tax=Nocardia caishijiensis TaxID=184756 RepID=A0ABQ6YTS4_9NOCA|nr:NADP-dependent oxidoreductase [Nocardia caishijiensis]KAF0849212.1 NADPH:quinone reductase-like Zn-dependent oxidoreductase [Nocardia caishijiensis]